MATNDEMAFSELIVTDPGNVFCCTVGPPLVGLVQLANGYVHGASLYAPLLFALTLVAFSVFATRHLVSRHRLARLERA